MGNHLTYKQLNSILVKLENKYLNLAKNNPDSTREGIYGIYAIKKVRNEVLKHIKNRDV